MPYLFNLIYLVGLLVLSPWLFYKSLSTGKYRRGFWSKFTGRAILRDGDAPCVWFHGVSVGEIHLLGQVVARFRRRHPDWDCVISTTTETGFQEACKRFADLAVFYWPFDFTWAVHRAIRRAKPALIVLAESEVWPNFLTLAKSHGVPVAVVNARMSPQSLTRYQRLRWLTRRWWSRIALYAVQTEDFADAFRHLGVPANRIHVTGSVKYDGVEMDRDNPRTRQMGKLLGIEPSDLVWIAGSTQQPEEELVLGIFQRLRGQFRQLKLILVPRQKEQFDAVAGMLKSKGLAFARRSEITKPIANRESIILVDTIGELGAIWGLADIAFVGGSLDGKRGGQNMIEPAAYGAAVLFGPHVWNFRDTARRLVAAEAAIQVDDSHSLETAVRSLLHDAGQRQRLDQNARALVLSQQGATERTVTLLDRLINPTRQTMAA